MKVICICSMIKTTYKIQYEIFSKKDYEMVKLIIILKCIYHYAIYTHLGDTSWTISINQGLLQLSEDQM